MLPIYLPNGTVRILDRGIIFVCVQVISMTLRKEQPRSRVLLEISSYQ